MSRGRSEILAEDTREMRLIGKPDFGGNFRQGQFAFENQLLGLAKAGIYLPLMRCDAGRCLEGAAEMRA